MKNKDVLIQALQSDIWESLVCATAYIDCPYVSDSDCHNENKYGTADFQIYCDEVCKMEWLEKEWEE